MKELAGDSPYLQTLDDEIPRIQNFRLMPQREEDDSPIRPGATWLSTSTFVPMMHCSQK